MLHKGLKDKNPQLLFQALNNNSQKQSYFIKILINKLLKIKFKKIKF